MINRRKLFYVVGSVCLSMAFTSASAGTFLNGKPLLKELVPGNPGLEIVVPLFEEVDSNLDGRPEKINAKFRVYPAGSTTALFSAPSRTVSVPANPCSNPAWVDSDWNVDFIGEGNSHTAMIMVLETSCEEIDTGEWKSAYGSFLYVADTTAGSSWFKVWANKSLVSGEISDWDDDQQDEIIVTLVTEGTSPEFLQALFIDKVTGTVESRAVYAVTKFSN